MTRKSDRVGSRWCLGAAASENTGQRSAGSRPMPGWALLLLLFLAPGCVTLDAFKGHEDQVPSAPVCDMATTWHNEVAFVPDPMHGGNPAPGLAGRLYLFGAKVDCPVCGDGGLVVDLYEGAAPANGKTPLPLEEWRIDKATLKRLLHRDPIGWGYTLFLPWGTYRPEITRVRFRLRYEPAEGQPIFTDSGPITLKTADGPGQPVAAARHEPPAAH